MSSEIPLWLGVSVDGNLAKTEQKGEEKKPDLGKVRPGALHVLNEGDGYKEKGHS